MGNARFIRRAQDITPIGFNVREIPVANVSFDAADQRASCAYAQPPPFIGVPRQLPQRVKSLDALPRRPKPDFFLTLLVIRKRFGMKRVYGNLERDQEAGVCVNHFFLSSLIASVKLIFGPLREHISAASRSRSALVLRGRFPALVTVNADMPLSVTTTDWPGCSAFSIPGEWKNSRVVIVFIRLTYALDGFKQGKLRFTTSPGFRFRV